MIGQIVERCIHMLGDEDPRVRITTIDTVAAAMRALKDHERKPLSLHKCPYPETTPGNPHVCLVTGALLPLVHQVWSPFLPRLNDQEILVILRVRDVIPSRSNVRAGG